MEKKNLSYFLISVSNKENLDLCIKHSLAGFTDSINGLWTYCDIRVGDYVSFLYSARAHNLYLVQKKEAIENAENLPPWKSITFKMSGKTYHFPFRLYLMPIRKFNETLVRNEFAYVAENLLLRGGYRKTHFQADQTTLQAVSQIGEIDKEKINSLMMPKYSTFVPLFTKNRKDIKKPKIFPFQEIILQSLIRQKLSENKHMKEFLDDISVGSLDVQKLEVLGEKALPEGHIDILIKESIPIGLSRKIIIEVKTGKASGKDFEQLSFYLNEFGDECLKGVLIARDFSTKVIEKFENRIVPIKYIIENSNKLLSFDELKNNLKLEKLEIKIS